MNSYLLAIEDPSRSTLRLFQESVLLLKLSVPASQLLQFGTLVHRQRTVLLPVLALILAHPGAEGLGIHIEFPGDMSDRLTGFQRQLDRFFTELRRVRTWTCHLLLPSIPYRTTLLGPCPGSSGPLIPT
jgi:hypothetical protein